MISQTLEKAILTVFRFLGLEVKVVRRSKGFEIGLFPLEGSEISPLELVVPSMIEKNKDFFFIQVGANDGIRSDSIRSFILKHHLKGILIEPLYDLFEKLRNNYSSEPQLIFENVAVSNEDGQMTLYRFKPDTPGPDYIHGMATFDKWKIRRVAWRYGLTKWIDEARVPSVTFQHLLRKHGIARISLLQIDTEGFDFEVVKMAMESGILPDLINYEFINLSLKDRLESYRLLASKGYSMIHGRSDTLAIREDILK